MFSKQIWIAVALSFSSVAFAKDIIATESDRVEYMKRAEVWFAPSWIDSNFNFSPELNVLAGPPVKQEERRLLADAIDCSLVPDGIDADSGLTRKFVCTLATGVAAKPTLDIKVKYGPENPEVNSELIGTRLLWALGFAADRMYFMKTTRCYGCSEDPFKKRDLDPTSYEVPREFSPTAIERKYDGSSIRKPTIKYVTTPGPHPHQKPVASSLAGWKFDELLNVVSDDPRIRADQEMKRNALTLLATFINHVDSKAQNQRLVCMVPLDANGKCNGRVVMMIQDLGAAFGKGFHLTKGSLLRVNHQGWTSTPIWREPARCKAGTSFWFTQSFKYAIVTESGREFLVKLLKGFSAGAAGRKRVEDLFRAGHVELRSAATAEQWADTFMAKVKELEFPMGEGQPNFKCPQ